MGAMEGLRKVGVMGKVRVLMLTFCTGQCSRIRKQCEAEIFQMRSSVVSQRDSFVSTCG